MYLLGFRELESASISSSTKVIDSNPFADCPKMARVDVPDDNTGFKAMNGVLFDKENTVIISCPQAMSWFIECQMELKR